MNYFLGLYQMREDVKSNAFWSKLSIDKKSAVDKDGIRCYKKHLEDCEKYPTLGLLTHKKYLASWQMKYPKNAKQNLQYLESIPEVDVLQKRVDDKIQKMYPKTKHARQFAIEKDRVMLDTVVPVKKHQLFDKIKIMLKRFV